MFRKALLIGLIIFVICSLGFVISPSAKAQPVFTGTYWILNGGITNPDSQILDGRQVVIYRLNPDDGFAADTTGPTGLSGREGDFVINALEEWRWFTDPAHYFKPGTYQIAIVNDNPDNMAEGYGADPVEFVVTGYGYDVAPELALTRGAGILPPERPEYGTPIFDEVRFGKRLYQPRVVERWIATEGEEKRFVVSATPRITATIASDFGVNVREITMALNADTAAPRTFDIRTSNIVSSAGPVDAPTSVSLVYDFAAEGEEPLPEGDQVMTFSATNAFGSTDYDCHVNVAGGERRLLGTPITFPSPLHLMTDDTVTIQYTLSHDMPVEINFFNIAGRNIKRFIIAQGAEGGSAGINKVTWGGGPLTDQGQKLSSGIVLFVIMDKQNNKVLGRGKLTALP